MSRYCRKCQGIIPDARRIALPDTEVCVACSDEVPVKGWLEWSHKTAPAFQIVTPAQHGTLQRYDRKRPGASLPMGSRSANTDTPSPLSSAPEKTAQASPDAVLGVAQRHQQQAVETMRGIVVNDGIPRARCGHADRPQVNASGKCVECAVAYYAMRLPSGAKFSGMA